LGNFATKLLSGEPTGITRVRGRAQLREFGGRAVYLYPIFHPAAALYTPAMLATLREDIVKLPELLASPLPESTLPEPAGEGAGTPVERAVDSGALSAAGGGVDPGPTEQLGLF
jgi:DNA polymerase